MTEDSLDITPHIPPIALTATTPPADGPAFEVWTADYTTKFGVVYQRGGIWIASSNIEFPSPFHARDDAIAILAMFRGKFPTPANPDETPDGVDTTDHRLNELRFPMRQVLDRIDLRRPDAPPRHREPITDPPRRTDASR
ncbi:hypothetical protein [Nocardia transvalensis]|uniref:hypothetical protein n=1 Tax=Nocardia transvalensis TaxID=37333 RepID=UPI00189581A7|nr:hypothetical protein [Nocardia transvalensis]MBF6333156.1 hypothetical protein [Nocardia transvalensis]